MSTAMGVIIILLLIANIAAMIFFGMKIFNKNRDTSEIIKRLDKTNSNQREIYKQLSRQQSTLRLELSNQDSRQRQEINSNMQDNFSSLSKVISENLINSVNAQNAQLISMEERLKTFSV